MLATSVRRSSISNGFAKTARTSRWSACERSLESAYAVTMITGVFLCSRRKPATTSIPFEPGIRSSDTMEIERLARPAILEPIRKAVTQFGPVVRFEHLVAVAAQRRRDQPTQVGVVFCNQDATWIGSVGVHPRPSISMDRTHSWLQTSDRDHVCASVARLLSSSSSPSCARARTFSVSWLPEQFFSHGRYGPLRNPPAPRRWRPVPWSSARRIPTTRDRDRTTPRHRQVARHCAARRARP